LLYTLLFLALSIIDEKLLKASAISWSFKYH